MNTVEVFEQNTKDFDWFLVYWLNVKNWMVWYEMRHALYIVFYLYFVHFSYVVRLLIIMSYFCLINFAEATYTVYNIKYRIKYIPFRTDESENTKAIYGVDRCGSYSKESKKNRGNESDKKCRKNKMNCIETANAEINLGTAQKLLCARKK